MKYTYFYTNEYETRYSNIIDEEEFEDEEPEAYGGTQKGNDLDEPQDDDRSKVKPWDPSENFFSYI
jgi:hypothetical protein